MVCFVAHRRAFFLFFFFLIVQFRVSSLFNSHPDRFKFLLFRRLCEDVLMRFGSAGCLIHNEIGFNDLGMTAMIGQQTLLEFGFSSSFKHLKRLATSSASFLDGRSDLKQNEDVFDPPTDRYRDSTGGSVSWFHLMRQGCPLSLPHSPVFRFCVVNW